MMNTRILQLTGALVGLSFFAGAGESNDPQPSVWLSKELIGMKVNAENGDNLGTIEDLVVHPGGETAYAVLSFGGWLGMGDKLFAMPWTVLKTVEPDTAKKDSVRSLVLPFDKERLKKAPGFDKKSWPLLANPTWTKDVDAFYVGNTNPNAARKPAGEAHQSMITWRMSELEGTDVKTPTGDTLGDVRELAIDTNGRVSYAVLSVGGFLGMGDRLVPVPWDSLTFSLGGEKSDKRLITLASTKEQLEKAPEFKNDKEHRAEVRDAKWIGRVYEYFSCPPYNRVAAVEAGSRTKN